ncbi:MAG: hypothetical protein LAP40_11405 [Acidobacteriia bacterium]|nr:hypothetical protein [Terriglobia bacterium]
MPCLKKHSLLLAAALWNLMAGAAPATGIQVIANPSVTATAISCEEIKGVFLETRTALSDGSHVEPVLLQSGVVHRAFVKEFLGKGDAALETYYRSLVFAGRGLIPKTLESDAAVVQYVAKTKGTVGYVSAAASVAGVKVLDIR